MARVVSDSTSARRRVSPACASVLSCFSRRYSLESLCRVSTMVRRALTIAYTMLYGCGVVSTFCRGSRSAASARVLRRTSPNTFLPKTVECSVQLHRRDVASTLRASPANGCLGRTSRQASRR